MRWRWPRTRCADEINLAPPSTTSCVINIHSLAKYLSSFNTPSHSDVFVPRIGEFHFGYCWDSESGFNWSERVSIKNEPSMKKYHPPQKKCFSGRFSMSTPPPHFDFLIAMWFTYPVSHTWREGGGSTKHDIWATNQCTRMVSDCWQWWYAGGVWFFIIHSFRWGFIYGATRTKWRAATDSCFV